MGLPENEKAYTRLTFDERCEIQRLLNANASLSDIGRDLGRSRSSIAREIVRNRRDDGYRSMPTAMVRLCTHVSTCSVKGLCKKCWNKRCASCKNVRCTNVCERFTPDVCRKNNAAPFCCNGCLSTPGCRLHRYRYDAKLAQRLADSRLCDSRTGIDTTSKRFESMIETARPLIKDNGQSIAHIWVTHGSEFDCSQRTFYRYVDLGLGDMKNLDLVAKCRYRPRKKRHFARFECPEERGWTQYRALPEEKRLSVVEIDCVEGVRSDSKVLLTMLLKRISFLLVFVLQEHTQECVVETFDGLGSILGERFCRVFGLLLADRGHEFTDFERIESGGRARVYYCDPGRADQKGSIENCHRLLRRIVPKGSSLEGFTQADAALVASHINSMPRKSLGGASPFDLAHHVVPQELLEGLGLEHIAPNDVVLKPRLLTGH